MATPWCRLWADMPNDPKWRTIAKVSKQRIGDVMSVYLHMMICASNATERGRTQGWCDEDVANALDIESGQVEAIRVAMQGRVLDGDLLSGWDRRQSVREDEGAAARAKEWREKQKLIKEEQKRTQPNASERNRTTEVEVEVDTEVEKKIKVKPTVPPCGETAEVFAYWQQKMNHPSAKLDDKRAKAIKGRIKDGYTVGDLCRAVDGCKFDPFSQGQNDRQQVYDDIELICRDGPKVDKFIRIAEQGPANGRSPAQNETISALQRVLERRKNHG